MVSSIEKGGVRVIAFEVDHGAAVRPAYGYRIEFAGRSAVISGDTRYNENVVKYGAGADLLIHEVVIVRQELASNAYIQRIMAYHTTAREAGMVFARAKPKLAAYTLLVSFPAEPAGFTGIRGRSHGADAAEFTVAPWKSGKT